FVLSAVVTIVAFAFAFRVGRAALLRYHHVLLGEAVVSTIAYALLFGYYQTLNSSNEDYYAVFVLGKLFLIIRNTVGLAALFLVCSGFYLLQLSMARATFGMLLLGLVARVTLNVLEFGLFQWSTNLGATTGLWGVSSQQTANLGWKISRVF